MALLALLVVGAVTLSGKTDDNFELKGIESTQAFDLIKERSPGSAPDGATARVVFEAPAGQLLTDSAHTAVVTTALSELATSNVQSVTDPFTTGAVSEDGRVGYATVSYSKTAVDLPDTDKDVLQSAAKTAEDAGLKVAIGGDAVGGETEPPWPR